MKRVASSLSQQRKRPVAEQKEGRNDAGVDHAKERDHREFKATKGAFETAENTHFAKQAAA